MSHIPEINLPPSALACLDALEACGITAWFDGGFVRNSLAKRRPGHVTLLADASCERIADALRKRDIPFQREKNKPLTTTALFPEGRIEIGPLHVVTERTKTGAASSIEATHDIESDLARRDFTINALAWHPERGLVDPYQGARDLRRGVIRTVGGANRLMSEEPLCSLRALRFASTMGFEIETTTRAAAAQASRNLTSMDISRVRHQLEKLLCGTFVREALLSYIDELGAVLPELTPMKGFDQCSRFHCFDVLEHTASVVANSKAAPFNRWAALLHDAGKPDTFQLDQWGRGHMPGHPTASIRHLYSVADRLGFDGGLTHKLELVIRHHDDRPAATEEDVRRLYDNLEHNDGLFRAICDLMRADSVSKAEFCQMERIIITNDVESLFDHMKAEGRI